jgi:hypothetical protein
MKRNLYVVILVTLVLSLTWRSKVKATDRWYSDVICESANGLFRFEARSPDNAKKQPMPFQSNFAYTLTNTKTKKILWQIKQTKDEASPRQAWVDEDGCVVLRTDWDELIVIDISGKVRTKFNILNDGFSKAEKDEFVSQTTAGPRWSAYSYWFFAKSNSTTLFCVRTWWDHRIILDLKASRPISDEGEVKALLDGEEQRFVMDNLKSGCETMNKLGATADEGWKDRIYPVLTAVHLAGRLNLTDALPMLKDLEGSEYSGRVGGRSADGLMEGDINPFSSWEYTLRRMSQLAIRRMGGATMELDARAFRLEKNKGVGERYKPTPRKVKREACVPLLIEGMTPKQALDVMGAPDYFETDCWDYDVEAEKPFTVRVRWNKTRIESIRRITPPVWTQKNVRDKDITS